MQKKARHGLTKAELLVVLGIFLLFFMASSDTIGNAKYAVRSKVCHVNFDKIGQAILVFRSTHNGKMPLNLAALPNKYALSCPVTGAVYGYRFLPNPLPDNIVCWDSQPQTPGHTVLTNLNKPNRNVLAANGNIRTLPEEQFQALHLPATSP